MKLAFSRLLLAMLVAMALGLLQTSRYNAEPMAGVSLAMDAVAPTAAADHNPSPKDRPVGIPPMAQNSGSEEQPAYLVYNEMRTVYLSNLARRENGVPPLRWNAQMTEAARWFSWDSVENRPPGYCGHQDTLGRWPSERVPAFGYRGFCGAENCFCGYVSPEYAVDGWMRSPGHRANLLDPNSRELGMGYYRRASDGRGYLTQDFGNDPIYPPLIIQNEALTTSFPMVNLYIYTNAGANGFAGMGAATEMMVSNNRCFGDASWETYTAEKVWALPATPGWHTVYVRTRDAQGRTTVASDTIYLGRDLPIGELGLHLASSTTDRVTLYRLNGNGLPYVQFSQNWFADDTFHTFTLWWGNGERVEDLTAVGNTAFCLRPGNGESFAWVWTTDFIKDIPFTAYFRLRTSDNTFTGQVARVSVRGGGTEYGPLVLRGTDFAAANVYQEFPLAFTFHTNENDVFLIFQFWRSGPAEICVDGVYIFTPPLPIQPILTWTVPGGNYRGGGIWLRYTDGANTFSAVGEADLTPEFLGVSPTAFLFLAERNGYLPPPQAFSVVQEGCEAFTWNAFDDADWLNLHRAGDMVQVSVDATGLAPGTYYATITVEAEAGVQNSPAQVPVTLIVLERVYRIYLPLSLRSD